MKFVVLFFISFSVHAAVWAVVKSKRAVVYADSKLTSPVGYFGYGKKIRVGEVKRNGGRVLPTVYNGKVLYIRIDDIHYNATSLEAATINKRIRANRESSGRR